FSNCRKKFKFPYFHTHFVMLFFIPKTSSHAAATGRNYGWFVIFGKVQNIKSYFLVAQGFLVTMRVNFQLFFLGSKLRCVNSSVLNFSSQKFLYQKSVFRNGFRSNLIVSQAQIFIPERKDCGRFNPNKWNLFGNFIF